MLSKVALSKIESKAEAGEYEREAKRPVRKRRPPCRYIDSASKTYNPKKSTKKKVRQRRPHPLDDNTSNVSELKSKYVQNSKCIGNKRMRRLEEKEIKKSKRFIVDDTDSNEHSLGSLAKNANDFTLLADKRVDSELLVGRMDLEGRRSIEKNERQKNARERLREEKIKRRRPVFNATSNVTFNINNTGASFTNNHIASMTHHAQPHAAMTNHMPPWTMQPTWVEPGMHSFGTLTRTTPGLMPTHSTYAQMMQNNMVTNLHHRLTGTESVESLIQTFHETCNGERNHRWLEKFCKALKMRESGSDLRRGYLSNNMEIADWLGFQVRNRHTLESVKQRLLEKLGI